MDQVEGKQQVAASVCQILCLVLFTGVVVKIFSIFFSSLTSPLREIPSPPGHFLLGHVPLIMRSDPAELYEFWFKNFSKNGMTRINMYGSEVILITRPEDIKKVLVSESTKYDRPAFLTNGIPALKSGIFGAEGKDHAWQRKLLNPCFTSIGVKQFAGLFIEKSSLLVKVWKKKIQKENKYSCTLVVGNDFKKLTFDIISVAAFGYNIDTLSDVDDENAKALEIVVDECFSFKTWIVNKYLGFLGRFVRLFGVVDVGYANKVVNELISEVIVNKEKAMKAPTDWRSQPNSRPDLLEIMMKLKDEETGSRMSDEVLKSNVLTFMIGGYDTSSSCLTWTLYLLAQNVDKQEKARREVFEASPENSDITVENIEKMPYVEFVLKESLRLRAAVPVSERQILEPVTLGGVRIPKGCIARIPMSYIHRSEEFWTNPLEFKPERFDVDASLSKGQKDIGYRYLPFVMGPRGCIGNRFAMLEMRVIIASLLKNFRFSISPNHPKVRTTLTLTMKPEPSPEIQVELVSKP